MWLAGALLLVAGSYSIPATAGEFDWGDVEGRFDTTLAVGVALRTEDPDDNNICTALGGTSGNCGNTDGNLNYEQGRLTSSVIQATHELDLRWRNYGAFGRVNYFYDSENYDGSRPFIPLPSESRGEAGADFNLLDAYVRGDFTPFEMPLLIKVGNQVISWGESTFLPNGINVINPIDVNRLRTPGSELREALLPVPAVYSALVVSDTVSIEAFWQWAWRETELEPVATFFSTSDALGPGGERFDISLGHNDCSTNPLFFGVRSDGTIGPSCLLRGADVKPSDAGQWGVAARFFVPWLNAAEFGLYFINYHSRLPYVGGFYTETIATAATALGLDPTVPANQLPVLQRVFGGLRAVQDYPEDIRKYGVSFSTTIETLDVAVQGEVSYSPNLPLQRADQEGTRALVTGAGVPTIPPRPGIAIPALGQFTSGGIEHRVYTGQMSVTKLVEPGPFVGDFLGASQLALVAEVGFIEVADLESALVRPVQGAVTPQSIAEGYTANLDADYGQEWSWGAVALARLEYNNAIWGWNLAPSIAYRQDINGTSPAPIGNFVEDRKGVTVALEADYLKKWVLNLSYTVFTGAGEENVLRDRDFLTFSVQYSF